MSTYISVTLQRRIRQQFCNRCAYCQSYEALMAVTFEIEHIIPQSAGGETVLENLCLACPPCNRSKANRHTALDPETGETVRFFHPQHDRWIDHFEWNQIFTELIPRTSIGKITIAALQMNRPQLVKARELWVKVDRHP
ncbi:MAG: HNH endonuclease [Alkalinema sp. CACIAM 70d]|nr:MAG: HNH endonuclease [Alkalinema sp. CACIAM 70d]